MIHDIKVQKEIRGWKESSLCISFNISGNSPEQKFKVLKLLFNWNDADTDISFHFKKVDDLVTVTLKDYTNYDRNVQEALLEVALNFIKEYKEIDSILYQSSENHEYIRFLAELFIYADAEQIKNISL